jgi:hypothetical protein
MTRPIGSCTTKPGDEYGPVQFEGDATLSNGSSVTVQYTLTQTGGEEPECQGILKWSQSDEKCGRFENFI